MDRVGQATDQGAQPGDRLHYPRYFPNASQLFLTDHSNSTALWEFDSRHGGTLPHGIDHAVELESIANALVAAAEINTQVLTSVPRDLIEYVLRSSPMETTHVSPWRLQNYVNDRSA